MPTQIFEDGIDLYIGLLEAEPVRQGSAYPFPVLHPTGQDEMRTFRTVLLENPFLRVTIVPALGGRLLSLFDKRTDTEILAKYASLAPQPDGRRGAILREGIQLRLDGEDRKNSLGNVAVQPDEAATDDDPAGVWISESAVGDGLSFHLYVSLPPDRAELRIEARVLNRTFAPLPYDGELAFHLGGGRFEANRFYSASRDAGLAIFSEDATFDGIRFEGDTLRFARFGAPRTLSPRQVDTWAVRVVPISGLQGLTGASEAAAGYLDDSVLRLQTTAPRIGHKLFVLTDTSQTLEAPADLYPEHALEIPLEGLPGRPIALELRSPQRETLLRIDRTPLATGSRIEFSSVSTPDLDQDSDRETLIRATFDPARRPLAHTLLGVNALREGRFEAADASFEKALLYNADDPLTWWAKAVAVRLSAESHGEEPGERPELLNAHFLAPLEPALRAEAFLSLPEAQGKEPSSLVSALTENPEEFIEVACLLIEHGLLEQANRWIDEALRHRDLAMLRLLLADILLRGTRMVAEVAEQVAAAQRVAGPPYPWRKAEVDAIRRLLDRFPADPHLRFLAGLVAPS